MKLPRDLSGRELAVLFRRYGYIAVRRSGSHMRFTSHFKNSEHHITVPDHASLKTGILADILDDVAKYLEMERKQLLHELFG